MKSLNLTYKIVTVGLIFFILPIKSIYSQKYYRIFLKDKGNEEFRPGSEIYEKTLNLLNQRALTRRTKVFESNKLISLDDAPLNDNYVRIIAELGVKIKHQLRWRNYLVALCSDSTIDRIKNLDFVRSIQQTSSKFDELIITENEAVRENSIYTNIKEEKTDVFEEDGSFDYGDSYFQNHVLGIDSIHQFGITGDGVLIGFIDSGFKWRKHISLKNSKIVAEYDFINNDSITSNESNDIYNQDNHGTLVISTALSNENGKMIGTSPNCSVILAKTEDLRSETGIEEDNFAAAIEWMESQGVDIINASLGYRNFDSTNFSYTYQDLDGNSALSSIYANMAVQKGIVFFNSVGNSGPDYRTLNSPADAFNVITVGSVDSNLTEVSSFSSRGPNSSGMLKPEFVAFGNKPVCANPDDSLSYIRAKGTSLTSPMMAGATALILSVFPELNPYQIRNMLISYSDRKLNPQSSYGYGIPDFFDLLKNYDVAVSPISYYRNNNFVRVAVFIISNKEELRNEIFVRFSGQSLFNRYELSKSEYTNLFYTDILINKFQSQPAYCYILSQNSQIKRRLPFLEDSLLEIQPDKDFFQAGVNRNILPRSDYFENRSFVIPGIADLRLNSLIKLIILSESAEFVTIKIYDSLGRVINQQSYYSKQEGTKEIDVSIAGYNQGAYFIGINKGKNTEILKFLVIN